MPGRRFKLTQPVLGRVVYVQAVLMYLEDPLGMFLAVTERCCRSAYYGRASFAPRGSVCARTNVANAANTQSIVDSVGMVQPPACCHA